MWSIESWARLEEDFERAKQNENEENMIKFDENVVYKTIFVQSDLYDEELERIENKTSSSETRITATRKSRRNSSSKTSSSNSSSASSSPTRKRNNTDTSQSEHKKKKYRDQPNQRFFFLTSKKTNKKIIELFFFFSCENRINSRMLFNWQYEILEEKYELESHPDTEGMQDIADELKITLEKVKNWFYNRRKRGKRYNK